MIRFFYILLLMLLVASCSGNNPVRYIKTVEKKSYLPFAVEYLTMPHDSFPLHYSEVPDTLDNAKEYSYSFIRNNGDTVVWEEGTIRLP